MVKLLSMCFDEWFSIFIEEKGLSNLVIEFEDKNGWNYFPIEVIQEYLSMCPADIQEKVKSKIVKLDFCNMNVSNFLEYIAKGIAKS